MAGLLRPKVQEAAVAVSAEAQRAGLSASRDACCTVGPTIRCPLSSVTDRDLEGLLWKKFGHVVVVCSLVFMKLAVQVSLDCDVPLSALLRRDLRQFHLYCPLHAGSDAEGRKLSLGRHARLSTGKTHHHRLPAHLGQHSVQLIGKMPNFLQVLADLRVQRLFSFSRRHACSLLGRSPWLLTLSVLWRCDLCWLPILSHFTGSLFRRWRRTRSRPYLSGRRRIAPSNFSIKCTQSGA
mmetsp:Transcript_170/g.325  ORF Transcript_170/g.325 Transcript_170/m.325 type:complete len:237 (-) Transcript_170:16-726(-)